jgi:hypothetical protein
VVALSRLVGEVTKTGSNVRMKRSVQAALGLLALSAVGTLIGVAARLPYQFGGTGEAARVTEDFVAKGTAVSPPLVAMVVVGVAAAIAMRRGSLGRVGSGLLAIIAAVFFVPSLGELMGAGAFSGLTQIFVIVWSLLGLAIIIVMFWSGAREALRGRPTTPSV